MSPVPFSLHTTEDFRYIDEGPRHPEAPPVVLLHGMLGGLSNWSRTVETLAADDYRVLVPALPVYDLPLDQSSVPGLTAYVRRFVERLDLGATVMAGNSLGGHVALLYALDFPDATSALVLSGASGIYEMSMGTSTLRRKDRDFIRERAELTFYDPKHATDELVDEMLELVNDRPRALRLIKMARSAEQETVTSRLSGLTMPTLLVWGQDDEITPPDVAYEFRDRLPNAELRFIDQCGHAPMIERPSAFDAFVIEFLETVDWPQVASTSEP